MQRRRRWCGLAALGAAIAGAPATSAAAPAKPPTSALIEVVDSGGGTTRHTARFVLGLDTRGRDSRIEVSGEHVTYKIALRASPAGRAAKQKAPEVEVDLHRSLRRGLKGKRPTTTTTRLTARCRAAPGQRVVLGKIDSGAGTTEVALTLR